LNFDSKQLKLSLGIVIPYSIELCNSEKSLLYKTKNVKTSCHLYNSKKHILAEMLSGFEIVLQ